jgi:hypothetical protein
MNSSNSTAQKIMNKLSFKKKNPEKEDSNSQSNSEEEVSETKFINDFINDESNTLNQYEIDNICKDLLNLPDKFPKELKEDFINKNYLKELEFFESNLDDDTNTVFNKVNNTKTSVGKFQLMEHLTNPTNNINVLKNRKDNILYFINNPDKLTKNLKLLDELKSNESGYMWFLKKNIPEMDKIMDLLYFNKFWNKMFNGNETFMNIYYICILLLFPIYGIIGPILMFMVPYIFLRMTGKINISLRTYWKFTSSTFFSGGNFMSTFLKILSKNSNSFIVKLITYAVEYGITKFIYYIFTIGTYLYGIYNSITITLSYNKLINFIHKKLNYFGLLLRNTKSIFELNNNFPCVNNEFILSCSGLKKIPDKFNIFWDSIFKNNPGYFTHKGNILSTYWKIKDEMELMKPYYIYLSHIDLWSSLADLVLKKNKSSIYLSLPTYYENTSNPQIIMEGFHNIVIPPDKVIKNNVLIGGNQPNNALITGANASGKSTCLKAIVECLILGQTIGVVPSEKCAFTPFKIINTYLNIPDCQGKESLFQAEMSRCQQQIKMLDSCKSDEFSFCIMDEIFVSTNYYEGVSGAYAIVNKVAKYPNAINIVTTHFPILSKSCMEHPDYTNYYFPIEFTENGDMMRTYKMTEGESKQHMAIKMLESKGFDIDIISDARNMYEKLIKKTKLEENQNEEEPNEEELNKEEQPEIKTNKEDKVEIETINKEEANKEEQSEIETNKEDKVEIGTINKEEESDIEIINKKKQNLKRKQKIKK